MLLSQTPDEPCALWQRAAAPRCVRASSWGRCSICRLQTCVINVLGRYSWVWLSVTREPPQTCPCWERGPGLPWREVVKLHPASCSRQYPRSDHYVPAPASILFWCVLLKQISGSLLMKKMSHSNEDLYPCSFLLYLRVFTEVAGCSSR